MKGSGAPGNRARAVPRSPPCSGGAVASESVSDAMTVLLTLIALLLETFFGYPERLLRAIGHPVIWMGRLIDDLDRLLNRDTANALVRRAAGGLALLLLIGIVAVVASAVE